MAEWQENFFLIRGYGKMVMKRKASRPLYRKKKRLAVRKVPRGLKSNVMSCTRSYVAQPFASTVAGGWAYFNYTFTLSGLQNYTEFTNLFGKYRINAIKLTFQPNYTGIDEPQAQANAGATGSWNILPRVHTIVDTSGLNTAQIDSESDMMEFSKCRTIRYPNRPFSIYIRKPCVHLGTANVTTIVGGAPKNMWIDTANYNVVHHGAAVGMIVPAGSSTGGWSYQVIVKYYMQFKEAQ